jgi:hypothetical protein
MGMVQNVELVSGPLFCFESPQYQWINLMANHNHGIVMINEIKRYLPALLRPKRVDSKLQL